MALFHFWYFISLISLHSFTFYFGFSINIIFRNFQKLYASPPRHIFCLGLYLRRQICFGHFLFTLILLQINYIHLWNLPQLDHAIFVVMTHYFFFPKNNFGPPKKRFSYLVYTRFAWVPNANGGGSGSFFFLPQRCDVTLEAIVFCL